MFFSPFEELCLVLERKAHRGVLCNLGIAKRYVQIFGYLFCKKRVRSTSNKRNSGFILNIRTSRCALIRVPSDITLCRALCSPASFLFENLKMRHLIHKLLSEL